MIKNYIDRENVFFLITLFLCIIIIFPYIFPFGLGVTFAYLLEPLVDKTLKICKFKKPIWRWLISLTLIFLTLVLIFGPILTIITTATQELISVLSILEKKFQGRDLVFLSAQKTSDLFKHIGIVVSIDDIIVKFTDLAKNSSKSVLIVLGSALYATPELILKTVIFILTWSFFLVCGKEWRARVLTKILPWKKERELITNTSASVIKALIVANVLVAIAQACLITICLALFGVPRFILLGMIGFFVSFVPIIGTAPLMLGAAAWCYFSEDRLFAAIGILVSGILISLFDNILRPIFMKNGAEIHFFWIFLAIICGISIFGISGAVIGPVSFALFAASLKTLEFNKKGLSLDNKE